MVKLAVIVAMAQNHVIGKENDLPWRIKADLQYFKKVTMGLPLVMGRKTFESIGKPLPGRKSFVLTRQKDWFYEGVEVSDDLTVLLEAAKLHAKNEGFDQVMVIGGAEVYEQVLPYANKLYLTEVHAEVNGDAFFPEFDKADWTEVERSDMAAEKEDGYGFSFVVLERHS